MDADSHLPTALQNLTTALLTFHNNHPVLTYLLLIIYATGVFTYSLIFCASLHDLRTVPWLPSVFLTDGILICCCPLAAVLPIFLWPLLVASNVFLACLRWFLAAPTFCGIRREVFLRPYKPFDAWVRRWQQDRRYWKQRRALLPVANAGLRHAPRADYGAVNVSRIRVDREGYSGHRALHDCMQYARQPPSQADAASVRSVPPPYPA
ncbi:hypothetical protein F5883DRAFT_643555 [Diaporthe sp. PMI_573]|nr:hypothetical protein F5883DRAFT_643555 [Diaporthaceae sp. PMI_573]